MENQKVFIGLGNAFSCTIFDKSVVNVPNF